MGAPAPEQGAAAPQLPGAGGVGGAQILQQIEQLLMQLAQSEPEPQIQQAVSAIGQQVSALQQVVGKDDMQDMQSGLANPGGSGGMPPGGEEPAAAEEPKSFAGAKKAAMANFKEKGHFSKNTPKGETPESEKSKNKKKG